MAARQAVVVTHKRFRAASSVVAEAVAQLQHAGFSVEVNDTIATPTFGQAPRALDAATEIVVVLGGDGTILRAAELVCGTDIPILGINLGHIGFLAEFESFQMSEAIGRLADKQYSLDERMLAQVSVTLAGAEGEPERVIADWALNDVTLERAERGLMVELALSVDGVAMSSFGCDGVIVSTPTGSTAYAFSAGGPVIWPQTRALELVPLAAHALFARPLIIGSQSTFGLDILPDSPSSGWVCCDGRRQMPVPVGSHVAVSQSPHRLYLARLSGVPFTKRLVSKFDLPVQGWRERRR